MLLLGAYPVDLFVSNVPARLVESFDVVQAAWLVLVATVRLGIGVDTGLTVRL